MTDAALRIAPAVTLRVLQSTLSHALAATEMLEWHLATLVTNLTAETTGLEPQAVLGTLREYVYEAGLAPRPGPKGTENGPQH